MNYWQGEKIRLRALEPEDAPLFHQWNQDSEMPRHLDFIWPPGSLEAQRQWSQRTATAPLSEEMFLVIETLEGQVAGMISTQQCSQRNGTFRYAIAIRPEHQHQGYAREAIHLLLRYFFEELRYQKVTVNIHANNEASIRLHEALGFVFEGRLRRMIFSGGAYWDELHYGLTVEEFNQLKQSVAKDSSWKPV